MNLREELKVLAILTSCPKVLELVDGLSEQELANRVVSKEKMIQYKLRGSPKLSKIFLSFGIPQKLVSLVFSAKAGGNSRISAHLADLRDQGNSIYFSSCQATDKRSKWFTHGVGNTDYLKIYGDEPHLGKSLFIWLSGDRMSVDGKGFKARAKLRLMYSASYELIAVYVDRIYGDEALLKADLPLLKEWVHSTFGNIKIVSATTQWSEKRGFTFGTEVLCPSAKSGYQDSTPASIKPDTYHKLLSSEKESYFLYKYLLRKKKCGVYQVRTGEQELVEERVRPHLTSKTRELIKTWISILGYPDQDSKFRGNWTPRSGNEFVLKGTKGGVTVGLIQQESCLYTFKGDTREALLRLGVSHTNVLSTSTELGFYPAVGYKTYGEIKEALNLVGLSQPVEVYRTALGNEYRVVIRGVTLTYNSETGDFFYDGKIVISRVSWRMIKTNASAITNDASFVLAFDYFGGYDRAVPVGLAQFLRLDIRELSLPVSDYKFYTQKLFGEQFSAIELSNGYLIKQEEEEIARVSSNSFIVINDNEELGLYKPVPLINIESVLIRLRKLLAFLTK